MVIIFIFVTLNLDLKYCSTTTKVRYYMQAHALTYKNRSLHCCLFLGGLELFLGRKLRAEIQRKIDRCKIPSERLTVGEQIGKGNFGLVYKGQLVTPSGSLKSVAVKTLKGELKLNILVQLVNL